MTAITAKKQSRWFRANLWLHRWASLVATLPFLILCLTGTVLIFHEEIDEAMGVLPPVPGLSDSAQPFSVAVENARRTYPDERVTLLGIDPAGHPGLLLLGTVPHDETGFDATTLRFAHLETGALTPENFSESETLTGFLLELHAQWFMGPVGEVIGAVIALLVLVSLFSGLAVYGPFAQRIAFGAFRRDWRSRIFQLDLHHFIGVIVIGWALVVSLTGFLLGFGTIVTGLWAQGQLGQIQPEPHAAPINVSAPPVDVDDAYAIALGAAPDNWRVASIIWPGTDFTTERHYAVLVNGSGLNERLFRVVLVDAANGAVAHTAELPWYMKTIVLSQPLHFGDYGGLLLKLLWTACTWLTLFITANGAWLWWKKRRMRKSAPRVAVSS